MIQKTALTLLASLLVTATYAENKDFSKNKVIKKKVSGEALLPQDEVAGAAAFVHSADVSYRAKEGMPLEEGYRALANEISRQHNKAETEWERDILSLSHGLAVNIFKALESSKKLITGELVLERKGKETNDLVTKKLKLKIEGKPIEDPEVAKGIDNLEKINSLIKSRASELLKNLDEMKRIVTEIIDVETAINKRKGGSWNPINWWDGSNGRAEALYDKLSNLEKNSLYIQEIIKELDIRLWDEFVLLSYQMKAAETAIRLKKAREEEKKAREEDPHNYPRRSVTIAEKTAADIALKEADSELSTFRSEFYYKYSRR